MTTLSRARLLEAFGRVGEHLRRDGVIGEVFVVGGAVMVLEHDARDATLDVDAFDFDPHGPVERAARAVADELGLPRSWLNQQASAFVPRSPDWRESRSFDHPNLRVLAIAPEQLLAMKVRAGRPTDADDIGVLCGIIGCRTVEAAVQVVESSFPGEPIPERGRELLHDLLDAPHGPPA